MPKGVKILEQAIKEAKEKNFVGDDILGSGYSCDIVVTEERLPIFVVKKQD